MNWDNLTLRKFVEIRMVTNHPFYTEDDRVLRIAAIVNEIAYEDLLNLPIARATEYVGTASFLYDKPVPKKHRNSYTLNGRKYSLLKSPSEMTTAQYIDYQTVIVEEFESHLIDLMSIILVPEGHNYNDGYDLEQVRSDIETLSVTEALGISDFFLKQYRRLLKRILLYSRAEMTIARMKAPKEMKAEMRQLEKEWDRRAEELLSMCGSLSLKRLLQ